MCAARYNFSGWLDIYVKPITVFKEIPVKLQHKFHCY